MVMGRIPSVGLLRSILPERDSSAAPKRRRQSAPHSITMDVSFLRQRSSFSTMPPAVSSTKSAGRTSLRGEGGADKSMGGVSRISQLFRRKSMSEAPLQSGEPDAAEEMVFILLELGLALCTVDPEMCMGFLKGCRAAEVATLRKAAGKILSELAPLAWPTAAGTTSIQAHVAAFLARHEAMVQAQELAGTMSEEEDPGTPRTEHAAPKVLRTSRTQISLSSHSEFAQTQRSFRISSSSQDSHTGKRDKEREKEREREKEKEKDPRRERKSVSTDSAGSGAAFLRNLLLKRAEHNDVETTGEVKWAKDGCPVADATVDGWAAQSRALLHKYRRQPTGDLNLLPSPTSNSNSTGVSLGLEQMPPTILLGGSLLMYFMRTHERALLAARNDGRRSIRKPSQVRSEDERTIASDMLLEQVLRATQSQDHRNLRATSSESFLLQAPERSNLRATSDDSSLLLGLAQDARSDLRATSDESFAVLPRDSTNLRVSSNESGLSRVTQDTKGTRTASNESFATGVQARRLGSEDESLLGTLQDFVSRQITSESAQEAHTMDVTPSTVDEMLAEYGRGGRSGHRARDSQHSDASPKSPRSSTLQDAPSIPPLRKGRTQPLMDDTLVDAAMGSADLRPTKDTPSSSSTSPPRGAKADRRDSRSSKGKSPSPDINLDEVEREFDPEARWRARKEAMRQKRQHAGEKVTYGRMLRGASSRSDAEEMGSAYTHRSNPARHSSPGARHSFGLEARLSDEGGSDAPPPLAILQLGLGPAASAAAGGAEAEAEAEVEAGAEAAGGGDAESPASLLSPSSGEEEDMAKWRRRREERVAARKGRSKLGSTYGSMVRHEAHELAFASQSHSQAGAEDASQALSPRIKSSDRDICSLAGPMRSEQEQALIRHEQERLLRETHHWQIWHERGEKGGDDMLSLYSSDRTATWPGNGPALPGAVLECRSWTSESIQPVHQHRSPGELQGVRRTWTNEDSSAMSPRDSLRP